MLGKKPLVTATPCGFSLSVCIMSNCSSLADSRPLRDLHHKHEGLPPFVAPQEVVEMAGILPVPLFRSITAINELKKQNSLCSSPRTPSAPLIWLARKDCCMPVIWMPSVRPESF